MYRIWRATISMLEMIERPLAVFDFWMADLVSFLATVTGQVSFEFVPLESWEVSSFSHAS